MCGAAKSIDFYIFYNQKTCTYKYTYKKKNRIRSDWMRTKKQIIIFININLYRDSDPGQKSVLNITFNMYSTDFITHISLHCRSFAQIFSKLLSSHSMRARREKKKRENKMPAKTRVLREPYRECTHFQTPEIHTPRRNKRANGRTLCWKSTSRSCGCKMKNSVSKNETQGGSLSIKLEYIPTPYSSLHSIYDVYFCVCFCLCNVCALKGTLQGPQNKKNEKWNRIFEQETISSGAHSWMPPSFP